MGFNPLVVQHGSGEAAPNLAPYDFLRYTYVYFNFVGVSKSTLAKLGALMMQTLQQRPQMKGMHHWFGWYCVKVWVVSSGRDDIREMGQR